MALDYVSWVGDPHKPSLVAKWSGFLDTSYKKRNYDKEKKKFGVIWTVVCVTLRLFGRFVKNEGKSWLWCAQSMQQVRVYIPPHPSPWQILEHQGAVF